MEKQRNKTLNDYLNLLNIDINELSKYELESLEKINEYYDEKLSELEEFTKIHIHALTNSLTKEIRNTKQFSMISSIIKLTKLLN